MPEADKVTSSTTTRVVVRWALVAAWALFIFFMSSRDATQLSQGLFEQVRQVLAAILNAIFGYSEDPVSPFCHFCEYAVFGFLLANALRSHIERPAVVCLVALVLASAYGITDEIHQIFVPGRYCDASDWLVDTCGAALGVVIGYVTLLRRRVYKKL